MAGKFQMLNANTYSFSVTGQYDATKPLILDPNLSWFTLGGSNFDFGNAIAVDTAGKAT